MDNNKILYNSTGDILKIIQGAHLKSFPNLDPNFFKMGGSTSSSSISAEQSLANPYANNAWVYACCNAIASNLIQIPKAFDDKSTKETELIFEHSALQIFDSPNPNMSASGFWETVILNLLLPTKTTKGGQCFILAESGTGRPVNLKSGETPKELWPFSAELMKPIRSKEDGVLIGWMLVLPDGKKIHYSLNEVIRIYLVDPKDPLGGQAPIWAGRNALITEAKANAVNEKFFDNNASLGGVLTTDADLGQDEVKALGKEFNDKYTNPDNIGRTAVLHSGLKYEQFQRSHADMQYIEQKKYSREEILAVYRVPKAEISLYEDVNFATAISANKAFWQKTLIPHDKRILEALNSQWVKFIDRGKWKLVSDYTNVEALQENFKEKLEQAKLLSDLQVPLTEINRRLKLNLDIDQYAWLKTKLVPFSLAPAEDVISSMDEPLPPPAPDDTESQKAIKKDSIDQLIEKIGVDSVQKADAYVENYNKRVIRPNEREKLKMLNKFFAGQRNRTLDLVDKWQKENSATGKAKGDNEAPRILLSQMKLDLAFETDSMWKKMIPLYDEDITSEALQMGREIGDLEAWEPTNPKLKKAMNNRKPDIKGVNITQQRHINRVSKKVTSFSIENKLSVNQTAELLRKEVKVLYDNPNKAKVIARTETGIMHAEARINIMDEEGISKIEWVTSQDEKVRNPDDSQFPHDILNGVVIDRSKGEMFDNGEQIAFPKDQDASAGNIINCRCTYIAVR